MKTNTTALVVRTAVKAGAYKLRGSLQWAARSSRFGLSFHGWFAAAGWPFCFLGVVILFFGRDQIPAGASLSEA